MRKTSKQYKDAKLQYDANQRADAAQPFSNAERDALQNLSTEYAAKIKGTQRPEAKQLKTEYNAAVSCAFDGRAWTEIENALDYVVQQAYDEVRRGSERGGAVV